MGDMPRLRLAVVFVLGIAAVFSLSSTAQEVVFDAGFDGGATAISAEQTVAPSREENAAYAPSPEGRAFRAEGGFVVYPGAIVPLERGSIELWVSPLPSLGNESWYQFTSSADSWDLHGVPRLWYWMGNLRFDVAGEERYLSIPPPEWADWQPGTWHQLVGTWDAASGDIELYLDGRLIGARRVQSWTPEPCEGFAVGSGPHINEGSWNPGHVLIDNLRLYDGVLAEYAVRARAAKRGITWTYTEVQAHPAWRNALAPEGEPGPELALARDGRAAYTILLPASPTSQESKAASDLTLWLNEMTGAQFQVVREGEDALSEPVISVGGTQRFAASGLQGAPEQMPGEGYGIGVSGSDLFLWGGQTRGIINAAYALLEEDLGCRWYERNSATIPHRPSLMFRPVPRTYAPVLEIRDPFYWDAFDADWSLRNRTNSPYAKVSEKWGGYVHYANGFFVHTYSRLVRPDTYFAEHPEYYSEVNGKRTTQQLCVTHPDVVRIATETVLETLRADPAAELISVSPNDGRGYCECARCTALDDAEGTKAASLLQFVNAIADAVKDEFPGVKVSTLAYLDTVVPPKTIRPHDNVVIRLCTDRHAWSHVFQYVTETEDFKAAAKSWADIGAKLHIWDYTVNFSHYPIPTPNMPVVSHNIRFLIEHNARGIMLQGAYQSPGSGRGPLRCWVWGKQLWDPELNTRDLIEDFTYGFYGAAAEPMQAYNELLWRLWEREHMGQLAAVDTIRFPPDTPFLDEAFLSRAESLFTEAEALADNEETLRRVKLAKFAVLYVRVAQGPAKTGERYPALLDELEAIVRAEGITHIQEGGPDMEEKLAHWRELQP